MRTGIPIKDLYFDWMTSLAMPNSKVRQKYTNLLSALNNMVFYFTIPLDVNRKVDGLRLRHKFGLERQIPNDIIFEALDNTECSMLEMMVALALRGEETIMYDPEIGDRLDKWFFEMIKSLELNTMTNDNFNQAIVEQKIDILLSRKYAPNGRGGLFTINDSRYDMRNTEIWYQMCWYFNAVLTE